MKADGRDSGGKGNVESSPDEVAGGDTERDALLALLRTSEARLREAQRIGQMGSWELNVEDLTLSWSAQTYEIFGTEPDGSQPDFDFFSSFVHPDDLAKHSAAQQHALQGLAPLDITHRIQRPDGTVRHVRERAELFPRQGARPPRLSGTVQDVTQQIEAEEVLRHERLFSESIIEALPGTMYFYTQSGKFLRWNRTLEVVSGYSAEEVARMHPLDFFGGTDAERVAARIREVFETGAAEVDASFVTKDGREIPYFLTGRRIDFDGEPCLVGVGIDMSERQRLSERLAMTLESITDAFYTLDREWRFTYVNHEAERLLLSSRRELIGRGVWDVFAEARHTEFHRQFQRAMSERTTVFFEEYYIPLNRWFEVRGYPSPQGLAVYFRDITDRRRAADQLRAFALRLESLQESERSAIAREVHDELGQALTVLRMDSSRLQRICKENPEACAMITEMNALIDATLQRTRSIAMALHPTALEDLGLVAAIEMHAGHVARRAELEIVLELAPLEARIDHERAAAAYRVLQESLTNVVRHAKATTVLIRLEVTHSELILEVRDNGIGISPERLTGAGSLGLVGMRERAAAFEGTVSVTRIESGGTRVLLHLPFVSHMTGEHAL